VFGSVRHLPSGRWQAHYVHDGVKVKAPHTFLTKTDARGWLRVHESHLLAGMPQPAATPSRADPAAVAFAGYAEPWLAGRDLRPSTRAHYRKLLDRELLPTFGDMPVDTISPATVRAWHADMDPSRPTHRAHCYALLRTILATAVADDLLAANPCRVRGAGSARRQRAVKPATIAELATIVAHTPERYRAMVALSSWCGLRFGEVTELRRRDVDLRAGTVRVERAVTRAGGAYVVGDPKSDAGRRTVAVPPHLLPVLREHLTRRTSASPDALLFSTPTQGHLAPSTVYGWFYPARDAAGRPDLRWHDLRHTGATLAAATGATLAELMHRLGHSTPQAAMIYQHADADRDRVIADALSALAGADVVPISAARG
jgi:integrase